MSDAWKTIRLELAPTPEFPAGSAGRAFLVKLPLKENGEIDPKAILKSPHKAVFRRLWASDPDAIGLIEQDGTKWLLSSAGKPDRMLDFSGGSLRQGHRASLVADDGTALPLQIVSVR